MLVFEEPESNAFPYYTKYLGEPIAPDETNQFFIATHNPYLLSAIIEKGRKEDVQVFVTYFKDFQTKVKPLTPDELSELMEVARKDEVSNWLRKTPGGVGMVDEDPTSTPPRDLSNYQEAEAAEGLADNYESV